MSRAVWCVWSYANVLPACLFAVLPVPSICEHVCCPALSPHACIVGAIVATPLDLSACRFQRLGRDSSKPQYSFFTSTWSHKHNFICYLFTHAEG